MQRYACSLRRATISEESDDQCRVRAGPRAAWERHPCQRSCVARATTFIHLDHERRMRAQRASGAVSKRWAPCDSPRVAAAGAIVLSRCRDRRKTRVALPGRVVDIGCLPSICDPLQLEQKKATETANGQRPRTSATVIPTCERVPAHTT